ncbi:thioesterase family protein [Staphylococcus auricularis]|uniref:3-hydroxyacyl-CoA dehydrogenase n=1 Tax=Staphylococcus auricularis TaxID=29379 RepID=A0ABX5IIL3_9STAP|nr:thioesterase family protein [Staphylococcus auricularis]MCE5038591.1 thioesterase family protein [Staphylococcus auricularis]MEB6570166.1 thioesterase family protein [Staphylococcus auricularis]PTH19607.1 3-hydroxyacyl-CoA dehydrogenase [Staphylococcus auricularis]PTH26471.1 3-hydroxyacyl-CoA dehydrogenase [Staphylococcus auricularis]
MQYPFITHHQVTEDMIDHNGHMHDSDYNIVFSKAINEFHYQHGLSLAERDQLDYTVFTAEAHTSYLSELAKEDHFNIHVYIYDYDEKRIHFFLMLYKDDDTLAATNEVMMIGIDRSTNQTAPFPASFFTQLEQAYHAQPQVNWPKQLGHRISVS